MNRNKATHMGSCQACGSYQKLPNNKLSLHGYDVKWGFFNGICRGSGELPYEQSFGLIEKFIAQAQGDKDAILKNIETLRQPAAAPKGWYHEYRSDTKSRRSGYYWREVEIEQERVEYESSIPGHANFYTVNRYKDYLGNMKKFDTYEYTKTVLEVATGMNAKYIEQALMPRVEQLDRYIVWQKQRIAEWKLTELKPVPPPTPPDPNRRPRRRRW